MRSTRYCKILEYGILLDIERAPKPTKFDTQHLPVDIDMEQNVSKYLRL